MRTIIFMLVISVIAVITLVLWEYVSLKRHRRICWAGLGLSAAAGAVWMAYGAFFPALQGSLWLPVVQGISLAAVSWIMMLLLCLPVLLIWAAGLCIYRLARRKRNGKEQAKEKTMSRRTFIKGTAAAVPAAAMAVSAIGNIAGESYLATTVHSLTFAGLPDYLEGYRIGQLSDTHMGLFFGPEELQQSLDAAAAAGVNRLEITGDLIDELTLLPAYRDILNQNAPRFPDGIDFCYGNHEYYRGFRDITEMLKQTPVRILRNSHICASSGQGKGLAGRKGRDARPFYIAGTDYSFAREDHAFEAERETFVQQALEGIPSSAFIILLAHHSDFIEEGFSHGIPLTLCGHTHGAQFAPIGPIVEAVGFTYLRGLYRKNECCGYVNRGTGHWLPLRFFCSREVSVFELHRKCKEKGEPML